MSQINASAQAHNVHPSVVRDFLKSARMITKRQTTPEAG